MASDVFYNRIPYTQRRLPPHAQHDPLAPGPSTTYRSIGTSRSGGALTFPPLYLDPFDPQHSSDLQSGTAPNNQGFVLGSTFYHHPDLNALVSNHLIDASAAHDGASGTGNAFLSSIVANRHGRGDDDSETDETGANDAAVGVPRPKITSEFVSLNEDLVPASLDMHGDMLPADQHPSYPFGNLFGPLGGVIAADSAIVGGTHGNAATGSNSALGDAAATLGLDFGGGLDGFIHLGQSSHGRRSAVSNGWNTFINKASRSKLVGSAGAEWNVDTTSNDRPTHAEAIKSAKKLDLSPSLLFRSNTATVLAPPTWPFRRHGPGCTSYAALLRPSSNIFGSSPASQALAATLGGLPASAKILKEVWTDLALEELVPNKIGESSAVRHLTQHTPESDALDDAEKRGKKRARTDPDTDATFARRLVNAEADPLDLLGPVSREIRGQACQPWGTASQRRRRRRYSHQSDDETAEAEHDEVYDERDLLRYSFALPPANFSWTESPDPADEGEAEGTLHMEPDGVGWSTAKRIFVGEERDRVLPEIASKASGAGGVEAYRVRGVRANQGLVPRPGWRWADGPVDDVGEASFVTEASRSRHEEIEDSEDGQDDGWEQGAEDEELQRALLMQYQQRVSAEVNEEDDVDVGEEDDEARFEYDLDGYYVGAGEADDDEDIVVVVDDEEDVESFDEADDPA